MGERKLKEIESLLRAVIRDGNRKAVTLRVFREEYEAYVQSVRTKSYQASIRVSFNHLLRFFPSAKLLSDLTYKDAEDFVIDLKKRVPKGYMVYFRNLKAALNKAVDWDYIFENPFQKVKIQKRQRVKPTTISEEAMLMICEGINNSTVRKIVQTGFYTGCRLGEIVNLSWTNVNMNERIIEIGDGSFTTKTKEQRVIPINDFVFGVLKKLKRGDVETFRRKDVEAGREYVFRKENGFPYSGDYVSKCFKRGVRKAGLSEEVHFHTLRHSFASYLVQKGVGIITIQELLGHKSVTTTQIYAHTNLETLRKAIKEFDESEEKSDGLRLIKGAL